MLIEGIAGALAFRPPQVFENSHVLRTIDLTGSYVKEAVVIDLKNTGSQPEDKYYYTVRSEMKEKIAIIEEKENELDNVKLVLDLATEQDSEK